MLAPRAEALDACGAKEGPARPRLVSLVAKNQGMCACFSCQSSSRAGRQPRRRSGRRPAISSLSGDCWPSLTIRKSAARPRGNATACTAHESRCRRPWLPLSATAVGQTQARSPGARHDSFRSKPGIPCQQAARSGRRRRNRPAGGRPDRESGRPCLMPRAAASHAKGAAWLDHERESERCPAFDRQSGFVRGAGHTAPVEGDAHRQTCPARRPSTSYQKAFRLREVCVAARALGQFPWPRESCAL